MPDVVEVQINSSVGVILTVIGGAPDVIGLIFGGVEGVGIDIIIKENTHNSCIPTLSWKDTSCYSDHGGNSDTCVVLCGGIIVVDVGGFDILHGSTNHGVGIDEGCAHHGSSPQKHNHEI